MNLINFKGVMGIPVAMAPIFVSSSDFAEVSLVKFKTVTSS